MPSILKYTFNEEENIFTVKFSVQFSSDSSHIVYVAYGYPYSFTEITSKLDEIQQKAQGLKNAYCFRETLAYSLEGRKLEMMTLSSTDNLE